MLIGRRPLAPPILLVLYWQGKEVIDVDIKDRAHVVALARLLGATGTDKEIFDQYWEYYQNALTSLTEQTIENPVTIIKRPF